MKNIWNDIVLDDYEKHMSMPEIGQAQLISNYLEEIINSYLPQTAAIIGCSGGNGLDRLMNCRIEKIICNDINPAFLKTAEERYKNKINGIEFYCADVASENFKISKADLIFGALIFEYVDYNKAINNIVKFLNEKGIFAVLIQLHNSLIPKISPSPYHSLKKLDKHFIYVDIEKFENQCMMQKMRLMNKKEIELISGKKFLKMIFQK